MESHDHLLPCACDYFIDSVAHLGTMAVSTTRIISIASSLDRPVVLALLSLACSDLYHLLELHSQHVPTKMGKVGGMTQRVAVNEVSTPIRGGPDLASKFHSLERGKDLRKKSSTRSLQPGTLRHFPSFAQERDQTLQLFNGCAAELAALEPNCESLNGNDEHKSGSITW